MVLVGNKCDREEDRAVTHEEGKKLAAKLGFAFFEASAKENINVLPALHKLVDLIVDKALKKGVEATDGKRNRNTALSKEPSEDRKGCAC